MNTQATPSNEKPPRRSHPNIDAIHTAKYDDLVGKIIEAQSSLSDPVKTVLETNNTNDELHVPESIKQEFAEFSDFLLSAKFEQRLGIEEFALGLEIMWDDEKKEHYIGNASMDALNLSGCNLDSIRFPVSFRIKKLNLAGNKLNATITVPLSVEELYLGANKIAVLRTDILPPTLKLLNLSSNTLLWRISGELPDSLESLILSDTSLDQLPKLPLGLKIFDCSFAANLTTLPELPDTLERLDISGCPQLAISKLPPNVTEVECSYCGYTEIPFAIPPSVIMLYCDHNKLTELPDFPNPNGRVSLHGNPLSEAAYFSIGEDSVYVP